MAVFWFGLGKKIKSIFSKKEADQYYLQKDSQDLQNVNGKVDFYDNIAIKTNGYVDNVDTNSPTSMINLQYFNDNLPEVDTSTLVEKSVLLRAIPTGGYDNRSATFNFNSGSRSVAPGGFNSWTLATNITTAMIWSSNTTGGLLQLNLNFNNQMFYVEKVITNYAFRSSQQIPLGFLIIPGTTCLAYIYLSSRTLIVQYYNLGSTAETVSVRGTFYGCRPSMVL